MVIKPNQDETNKEILLNIFQDIKVETRIEFARPSLVELYRGKLGKTAYSSVIPQRDLPQVYFDRSFFSVSSL